MLATAQGMCPNVLEHDSKTLQDLRQLCDTKSRIPNDYVKNLVNDAIGTEITNKVNEMNLIIANHISDKVIDDVIDNLSRTYKGLVGDVGSLRKKRSLTPDVLKVITKWWSKCWNKHEKNFRDLVSVLTAWVRVRASLWPETTTVKEDPHQSQLQCLARGRVSMTGS